MPEPCRWIDSHAHLDDNQFDEILDDVITRATDAGVARIITVGTTAATSRKCVEIADRFSQVSAAVGIQPNYVGQLEPHDWSTILELANHPKVVAIGETGLDYYWDYAPLPLQEEYFIRHVELAQQIDRPFIVHMRDPATFPGNNAESPCAAHLHQLLTSRSWEKPLRGVMHSYTGGPAHASQFVALGLHISFAGMVTFKKSTALRDVARQISADRLLVETDAPYLSPEPHRGRRPNEPAMVVETGACLAQVRGVTTAQLAACTTTNAERLFQFI